MERIKFYKANNEAQFTMPGDVLGITVGGYDTDTVYNLTSGEAYTLSQKDIEDAKQITHRSYPLYKHEQKNLERYNLQTNWDLLQ